MSDSTVPALSHLKVHGNSYSYYTGKLEGYLRAKGLAYEFVEMDSADWQACARQTGVTQMPQLEMGDGTWRTDSTPIIAAFEQDADGPRFSPSDAVTRFWSLLLEDYFDEWHWRPAMYYRWAFNESATLMADRLAATIMRDVKAPGFVKRWIIRRRQFTRFVQQDGVTSDTRESVESVFLKTVDQLEPIFASRPYLFGERPCEADFGLFGPFFRHYSTDPTPLAILRQRGPHTLAWVTRLWSTPPGVHARAAPVTDAPEDLGPLIDTVVQVYLPYLRANADAVARGAREMTYRVSDTVWTVPVSPYRVACLAELQRHYMDLGSAGRGRVAARHPGVADVLEGLDVSPPSIPPAQSKRPVDSQWR